MKGKTVLLLYIICTTLFSLGILAIISSVFWQSELLISLLLSKVFTILFFGSGLSLVVLLVIYKTKYDV